MPHSERHEELVAAAALGMPLGADAGELASLLAGGCALCGALLGDLRVAGTALAAGVAPIAPPPELKGRILRALGPSRVPAPPASGAAAWRVFAAAAVLLLVAVGLDDSRLRREREELRSQSADLAGRLQTAETRLAERTLRARVLESEDVQMMLLGGKGPQPEARGRVFWSPQARRGVLVAASLAALPSDRQYELWVFLNGKPVNAGVFDVDASGRVLFESTDFPEPNAQNFAVTVEPRGGVPAPTGPVVLVGSPT
ncbi:MAG TPA: anti-sigma factor [Thermoanaerobaculia bacterium]|jgi:anti-sigma-K factor RskA|nr:anti-sigma factor [Thermoanaerobaculia bacterium]